MDPDLARGQLENPMAFFDDLVPMPGAPIRSRPTAPPASAIREAKPAPSFEESMGTEMVDLYIGPLPTAVHFRVHKSLLCTKIPYFSSMFRGSFIESRSNRASFPEDRAESFDVLLGWIYTHTLRSLALPTDKPNHHHQGGAAGIRTTTTTTVGVRNNTPAWDPVDFYKLADRLCVDELKDEVLDCMIRWCQEGRYPALEMVGEMYRDTVSGSGLRKYGIALLRYGVAVESLGFDLEAVGKLMLEMPDLMMDYLASERELPDSSEPHPFRLSCRYHCHKEGKRCGVVVQREKEDEESRAQSSRFGRCGGLRGDGYVPYSSGPGSYRHLDYSMLEERMRGHTLSMRPPLGGNGN